MNFSKLFIYSFCINILNKLIVFLSGAYLIRILGKNEYGIYVYIISIITILLIPIQFGISNLIVKETSRGISTGNQSIIKGLWIWSYKITIALIIIIIVILVLLYSFISDSYSDLELTTLLYGLTLLPFQTIILISSASLRGLGNIIEGQLPNQLLLPFTTFLMIIFYNSLLGNEIAANSVMIIRSFSTLFVASIALVFLVVKIPKSIVYLKPNFMGNIWLKTSLFLAFSSGLIFFRSHLNILLIGILLDPSKVAIYQVSVSMAALSGITLQVINPILAPQFASLHIKKEKEKLEILTKRSAQIVFLFTCLITMLFILFGKYLIKVFFSSDLLEVYPILIILLFGQIINGYYGPVAFLLNMTGYEKDATKAISFSTLFNLITILLLTPIFGIKGTAISIISSSSISQILMHRFVKKKLNIDSVAFKVK